MTNVDMIEQIEKGADASDLIEAEVNSLKAEGRSEFNLAAEYAYALGSLQAKLAAALETIVELKRNKKRK